MSNAAVPSLPQAVTIGSREITLRSIGGNDREAIMAFARSLPEHDLLFLRRDITQGEVVDEWLHEAEAGEATTILADAGGAVVGYATVYRSPLPWTAHVGELRVLTAPSMRGLGLGRVLTGYAFDVALAIGIEKMVAQMTLDQEAAIATFQALGFRPEAVLRDHVRDRAGRKHDLIVLTRDVARFERERQTYGVLEAFGRP